MVNELLLKEMYFMVFKLILDIESILTIKLSP
jgi:hypothetical protein